jgi:hypothetical protein
MKTDELIQALAADNTRRVVPIARVLLIAMGIGVVMSAGLFTALLHARADINAAAHTFAFVFKVVVALSLVGAAGLLLMESARPLPRVRAPQLLVLAPLLLISGVISELSLVPVDLWSQRWIGHNAGHCLSLIPLLALAPAAALLLALRRGAPAHPALAGAAAGLVAGGFGAALYAFTCPDDSPLFVATWYTLAVAFVTGVSAFVGSRLLRW